MPKMESPLLSVIIPTYNEEKTLKKIIKRVQDAKPKNKEIIVVDDFSTDKTKEILKNLRKEIKIIKHLENKGKGESIKTGLEHVTGKITIIQDADLEYNPEDYKKIIGPILKGETRVVYGSRFLENDIYTKTKFYYGNKFLSLLTSIIYNQKITDMETCYKAMRTDLFKSLKLKSKNFEIEPEITSKLLKKGYKIKEIPISYNPRTAKEGKKIKIKDGIIAIYVLIKYRLFLTSNITNSHKRFS